MAFLDIVQLGPIGKLARDGSAGEIELRVGCHVSSVSVASVVVSGGSSLVEMRHDAHPVDWARASPHFGSYVGDQFVQRSGVKAFVPGPHLKPSFDDENDTPIAAVDLPLMPAAAQLQGVVIEIECQERRRLPGPGLRR